MFESRIALAERSSASFQPAAPLHLIQRKCACGGTPGPSGECEECRRKRLSSTASEAVPPIVHDALRSSGRGLDADVRAAMEIRFGYDFSRVRVHTGVRAAESAKAINAQAYTAGRDVVFGHGAFAPRSQAGEKLLIHELAHVVQQSRATAAAPGPYSLGIGAANDRSEIEAERIAGGNAFRGGAQSGLTIQRLAEGSSAGAGPGGSGQDDEVKLGGDCTTACGALESMRNSVKHLCELAGERDRRCIEARKKLARAEGNMIGMGCKCAMPIV